MQGLAELLPVSDSAHWLSQEKLMGLDPSTPQMTLAAGDVLHTGTMFAVIAYFWKQWKNAYLRVRTLSSGLAMAAGLGDGDFL